MQEMMMHCLNPSVLERQRAHLQWQDANNLNVCENFFSLQQSEGLIDGWPNLNASTSTPSPTTTMCNSSSSAQVGKEKSSKKRKADKSPMVSGDEEERRLKADGENKVEKQKGNKREDSGTTSSKENNDKKLDYIHVRARRGQATDSHSLAERVRRERISERMKYLQGLVPGCNKITGKAGMLDEIINYVQSLQRQVEFLSMKLAAVNPRLDFNLEQLFTKEMNLSYNSSIGIESEIIDPSVLQFNFLQQAITSCGYDMGMSMNPTELALQRSISPPANEPPPFLDSNFNVQRSNPGWDNDLQNLYGSALPFLSLQGNHLSGNLKTEM